MKLHLVIGICVLLSEQAYSVDIHNYTTDINWFDASKLCGESGLEHDLSTLSNLTQLKDEEFWIGKIKYNELTPWMEHLGCFRSNRNENPSRHFCKQESVGLCQHNCQSKQYFSYQRLTKECQCYENGHFKSLIRVNMKDCTKFSRNNKMVYKQFHFNIPCEKNMNCMVSSCRMAKVKLSPHDCGSGSGVQGICEGGDIPYGQYWNLRFAQAEKTCSNKNRTLASPMFCNHGNKQPVWTRIFCEKIAVKYSKKKIDNEVPVACLSGKREKILLSPKINIIEKNCSDKLRLFACKANKYLRTSNQIIVNQFRPSTDITVKTGHDSDSDTVRTSSNTGALAGGIVGGLISVLFVALLIVWFRRNRNNQAATIKDTQSSASQEFNTVNHISIEQYGLEADRKITIAENAVPINSSKFILEETHEYAVVQKQNDVVLSEGSSAYAIAADEEYDRLNNIMSRKKSNELKNVYGFAGQCVEGEYDTMKGMSVLTVNSAGNLYDSNVAICSENSDQTYDSSIKFREESNNLYDHSK